MCLQFTNIISIRENAKKTFSTKSRFIDSRGACVSAFEKYPHGCGHTCGGGKGQYENLPAYTKLLTSALKRGSVFMTEKYVDFMKVYLHA